MQAKPTCPYLSHYAGLIPDEKSDHPTLKSQTVAELGEIVLPQETPLVKASFSGRTINIIKDPKLAKLIFADHYRKDSLNENHPLKKEDNFIWEYLYGNDSILSADKKEAQELKVIFLKFLKTITKEKTIDLCQQALIDFAKEWKAGEVKEIELKKEIAKLLLRITVQGMLGFSAKTIEVYVNEALDAPLIAHEIVKAEVCQLIEENAPHVFLQELLSYARKKHPDKGGMLAKEALNLIVHNYFVCFFSIFITTHSLLTHLIIEMATEPSLFETFKLLCADLQKLYIKIEQDAKNGQEPSYEIYCNRLKELDCVMQELLRMYSPGALRRTAAKTLEWKDDNHSFIIKEDEDIYYFPFFAGKKAELFEVPETFDPLRFRGDNREKNLKLNQEFMHFGGGVHGCPGKQIASLEIPIIFSFLLEHFDFSMEPKDLHYRFYEFSLEIEEKILVKAKLKKTNA